MNTTKWFDRKFSPQLDNGLFWSILERLEGTPARIKYKTKKIESGVSYNQNGKWSINKEVGHLLDLEPLWYKRFSQIINGVENLADADLENNATHNAAHDNVNLSRLIDKFEVKRSQLIEVLRNVSDSELDNSSTHPRLKTQMKLIDLAYFVAEHDDHHLGSITKLLQYGG